MTHRERFNKLFSGETVDRAPFIDMMGPCNYRTCLTRWRREGMSETHTQADIQRDMGFDYVRGTFLRVNAFVHPAFAREELRREEGRVYFRNAWGGVDMTLKDSPLMALPCEPPVKTHADWERVRQSLQPDLVRRLPADLDAICAAAAAADQPVYAGDLPIGFFGGLRELLGLEPLMYALYDDPDWICEMLDTLCDLWIAVYTEICRRAPLDYFFIWEDMCSKNGPLISPAFFARYFVPRYRRLTDALRGAGCRNVLVDSDGDERPLVPYWMEGGVNIIFPLESQFGLDVWEVRRQYPTLGLAGGLNKRALELGRKAMDEELKKLPRMLAAGYYIPSCDHGVTDGVSWDDYRYFYENVRELIYKYPPCP